MPDNQVPDFSGNVHKFTGFSDLYPKLTPFLDSIKKVAKTGNVIPQKTSGAKPPAFITDAGAKAYASARGDAQKAIAALVKTLTNDQLSSLSGIGFSNPPSSTADDVTNSALTAWDKAASKYMNNLTSDGDTARDDLQKRLQEFDAAMDTGGQPPVSPDT